MVRIGIIIASAGNPWAPFQRCEGYWIGQNHELHRLLVDGLVVDSQKFLLVENHLLAA